MRNWRIMRSSTDGDDLLDREGIEKSVRTRDPVPLRPFDVSVSIPPIRVRLVDATMLGEYKIWATVASFLASVVTGFTLLYIQALDTKSANANLYAAVDLIFVVMLIISCSRVIVLNRRLDETARIHTL